MIGSECVKKQLNALKYCSTKFGVEYWQVAREEDSNFIGPVQRRVKSEGIRHRLFHVIVLQIVSSSLI